MKNENSRNDAVSPVVGVMLMLVVTIIIAALVSAFAGGLGSSTEQTPVITFSVDYGRGSGLALTCTGASAGLTLGEDLNVMVSTLGTDPTYYQLNASKFNYGEGEKFVSGTTYYINTSQLSSSIGEFTAGNTGYPHLITASGNYNINGEKFIVRLVSDRYGIVGSSTGTVKA